jgi:hypothetical protein
MIIIGISDCVLGFQLEDRRRQDTQSTYVLSRYIRQTTLWAVVLAALERKQKIMKTKI